MRQYSMIELYEELTQYSEFILKQLASCEDDIVCSIAAKRVLLMKSLLYSIDSFVNSPSKEFALVVSDSGFVVMSYGDWVENPIGCVLYSSDNLEELRQEANWRNDEIDFMEEYGQYSHFDGSYKSL